MKMANAMFPPSSVEPAVASATGAQHDEWNNLNWRGWMWQESTTRPVWGWQTQVSATDYYINTNTWMDKCAQWLGQADVCWHRHRTHKKVRSSLSFGLWKETSWVLTSVAWLSTLYNTHGQTHLPKHGCHSSHGWLQEITLSVRSQQVKWHSIGHAALCPVEAAVCCLSSTHHLATTFFNWYLRSIEICCGYD